MAEIINELNNMLEKDSIIKWTVKAKKYFESIKQALTRTPVLISPYYTKNFIIFSFTSEHTIAAVLLHKNDQSFEQPIAFFSKSIRDAPQK